MAKIFFLLLRAMTLMTYFKIIGIGEIVINMYNYPK